MKFMNDGCDISFLLSPKIITAKLRWFYLSSETEFVIGSVILLCPPSISFKCVDFHLHVVFSELTFSICTCFVISRLTGYVQNSESQVESDLRVP